MHNTWFLKKIVGSKQFFLVSYLVDKPIIYLSSGNTQMGLYQVFTNQNIYFNKIKKPE